MVTQNEQVIGGKELIWLKHDIYKPEAPVRNLLGVINIYFKKMQDRREK
jgi:hypothetical protein